MTEPLERDNVIELLKRLGSDEDEAVLEAARQVHAQITVAGMTWEDLLAPDVAADDGDDVEYQDTEDEAPEPPAETAKKNADSLALIDELLAKTGISVDLHEELENYKTDIAKSQFEEADRRYVRAVHGRLSKRR
jgi:hypothetical protein